MDQSEMQEAVFRKILHAYDGSERAFDAFKLALGIAKQNNGELHLVSVAEIEHFPQFISDVREQEIIVGRRVHGFLFRARAIAAQSNVALHNHVVVGHPVRDIVRLAWEVEADLLVIGARVHSSIYRRVVGGRANEIMRLAHCPVLVVKSAPGRRPKTRSMWNQFLGFLGVSHDARESSAA